MFIGKTLRFSILPVLCTFAAAVSFAETATSDGYTFVFSGKKAQLYGMDKKVIHEWNCQNNIQYCADLLRDSSIIVSATVSNCAWAEKSLPITHGRLQIINWKGEVTWDYQYCSVDYAPHHDIEPVYRTNDPKEKPTFFVPCYTAWGDKIVEIRPTGAKTGEVIWEWVASDHVCTTGCSDKPEVLDKAKGGSGSFNKTSDAMHVNGISYNRRLDQIIISTKGYNEFIVVDHSTTTAEAKGTTGGKSGKGGSILYRWGKPANYGSTASSTLNSQHHCCWVPDTMPGTKLPIPGGGNFMAVNNNDGKNGAFMEIANPDVKNGKYPRSAGAAFEPVAPLWKYTVTDLNGNEGSIQKLPNGNYFVCTGGVDLSSMGGGGFAKSAFGGTSKESRVFEVTPSGASAGNITWELADVGYSAEAYRYAYGYLSGAGTSTEMPHTPAGSQPAAIRTIRDHSTGMVRVTFEKGGADSRCSLYSPSGRVLMSSAGAEQLGGWSLGRLPAGLYFIKIQTGERTVVDRLSISR